MTRTTGVEGQILPKWVEVRSQAELERALTRKGTIPICLGDGSFSVHGSAWVYASDVVTVAIRDGFVQAGGAASVIAEGTVQVNALDRATVVAKDSAAVWARDLVSVEAGGNSRVAAWNRGRFAPFVHALDSATVEARGSAVVNAHGEVTVLAYRRAVVNAMDQVSVCAWDAATVRAEGTANVYAWGRARVDAYGAAHIDAWQAASVRAHGSCEVRARGTATVELQGQASAKPTPQVTVLRRRRQQQEVEHLPIAAAERADPLEWCGYHGVEVVAEAVTLYKAVDDNFRAPCGTVYAPGSMPDAATWDDGERERDGHQLCPHPSLAFEFAPQASRFVACPVTIGDLAALSGNSYRTRTIARRISASVYEVDLDGKPIP